jgi:hypothetical protein
VVQLLLSVVQQGLRVAKVAAERGVTGGVTTQDFIKFWGKIFAFVLLEMIEFSQGFETF